MIVEQEKNRAPEIQAVIICLRDQKFGIEISSIREISKMTDLTIINEPEGFIKGVVNLRGQVIVVVDFAGQFGFFPLEKMPQSFWIVFIERKKKILGLIVDHISDVVMVSLQLAGPGLENMEAPMQAEYIKGVGTTDNGQVKLLDMEKIFSKFIKE